MSRLSALIAVSFLTACSSGVGGSPDASSFEGRPDASRTQPDAASTCSTNPCDLHQQCGCSRGEACDVDFDDPGSGDTACREVTGELRQPEICEVETDCAPGYVCATYCREYCERDAECQGDGSRCAVPLVYDHDGDPETPPRTIRDDANVCSTDCDPMGRQGCPSDAFACHWQFRDPDAELQSGDEFYYTDCYIEGAGGRDAECENTIDCATGYTCVFVEDNPNVCREVCEVDAATDTCPSGRQCVPFNPEPVPAPQIGSTEYGFCDPA